MSDIVDVTCDGVMMAREPMLGSLEQLVLLALLRLRDNAYGRTIHAEVEQRTGRTLSMGAVYVVLERLEGKGYATSSRGASSPTRGGRAKRFFTITATGQRVLADTLAAVRAMVRDDLDAAALNIVR
jgi:DNA-binding PadR family transcriptional regulator